MKLWKNMFKTWESCNVPEVEIRKFIIGEDTINSPWFNIKRGEQEFYSENPLQNTAYHLGVSLQGKSPELIAAYKIWAVIKQYNTNFVFVNALASVIETHGEHLSSWWNRNRGMFCHSWKTGMISNQG